MWSRMLYWDRTRNLQVWLDQDEDGLIMFRHVHTAWRDVIELNQEYVKANPKDIHAGNTQKHAVKIGEIPLQVWMRLKDEGIANDPRALRKWLNDYDNRFFKTYQGRV
jgi:hypothetical protein